MAYSLEGTSHFASLKAAIRYFATQELDAAAVRQMLKEGSIHLGPPKRNGRKGELVLIDGRTRYAYETK